MSWFKKSKPNVVKETETVVATVPAPVTAIQDVSAVAPGPAASMAEVMSASVSQPLDPDVASKIEKIMGSAHTEVARILGQAAVDVRALLVKE